MKTPPPPTLLVTLAADDFTGKIVVPLEPFLHYAEDLRQDLEDLEYKWKFSAPPASSRHSAHGWHIDPR